MQIPNTYHELKINNHTFILKSDKPITQEQFDSWLISINEILNGN